MTIPWELSLAEYALDLFRRRTYPSEVWQAVQLRVLDSVACALGAYREPSVVALREWVRRFGGRGSAAVWGDGSTASASAATLVNAAAVRALDFNDVYLGREGGHPSDGLSAAWAVAEAQGRSPMELLAALVVGYQVHGILADSASLRERGFDNVYYGAIAAAVMAGLLLDLQARELAEAVRIAAASSVPLLVTRYGHLTMWKGVAAAFAAHHGVEAAELAACGVQGPSQVFTGRHGVVESVAGSWNPPFLDPDQPYRVLQTRLKRYPAQYPLLSAVEAAVRLHAELGNQAIEEAVVTTFPYAYQIAAQGAERWHPQSRETADHSLPYCVARALLDGDLTVESFAPERLSDPALQAVLAKLRIEVADEGGEAYPPDTPVHLFVRTSTGRRLEVAIRGAQGSPQRPLTLEDLRQKFWQLTHWLGPARQQQLFEALRTLPSAPRLPRLAP